MTPTIGLLLVSVLWGATFVAVKEGLLDASPLLFVGLRFCLASIAALALLPRIHDVRRVLMRGLVLGVVLGAGYATQTLGLVTTTPSRSAFLTGLNVSIVPLWALAILGQRPGRGSLLGLALAVPGLWFLVGPGALTRGPGDAWTAACAALFALHVVLVAKWSSSRDSVALLLVQLIVTAALCLVAAAAIEDVRFAPTPRLGVALLGTSLFATAFAIWLQLKFQPRVNATRAAMIYGLEPAFAALFAMMWGESIPPSGWLGGALIGLGALVSEWGARRAAPQ